MTRVSDKCLTRRWSSTALLMLAGALEMLVLLLPCWPSVSSVTGCTLDRGRHRPEWVLYVHAGFDIAACLCIYMVGGKALSSRDLSTCGSALFLYPAYWTYDPRIRSENLLMFLSSAWLWGTVVLPYLNANGLLHGSWIVGRFHHSVQAGDNLTCRSADRSRLFRNRLRLRKDGSRERVSACGFGVADAQLSGSTR